MDNNLAVKETESNGELYDNFQTEYEFIELEVWVIPGSESENSYISDEAATLSTSRTASSRAGVTTKKKCLKIEEYDLSNYKVSFIFTQSELKQRFENHVNGNGLIITTLNDNTITVVNALGSIPEDRIDAFEKEVVKELSKLQNDVLSISGEFDEDKYGMILKLFDEFLAKNTHIKAYRNNSLFEISFAFGEEKERARIQSLIDVVKRQFVISTRINIGKEGERVDIQAVRKEITSVTIDIDWYGDQVTVTGFEDDVREITNSLRYRLRGGSGSLKSHRISKEVCALMQSQIVVATVTDRIKKENVEPIWWRATNERLYMEVRDEDTQHKASSIVSSMFRQETFNMTPKVFQSNHWKKLKQKLSNEFGDTLVLNESEIPKVRAVATDDVFSHAQERLTEFQRRYKIREHFEIATTKYTSEFMLTFLKTELEEKLSDEFLKLEPGPNDRSISVSGTNIALEQVINLTWRVVYKKYAVPNSLCIKYLQRISTDKHDKTASVCLVENKTQIILKQGRIEEEQVDVIVNSASPDLIINVKKKASVRKSISKAAGSEAQQWLLENVKTPVEYGRVVEGISGNLKCSKLYHIVLRDFDDTKQVDCKQKLMSVLTRCLTKANVSGYACIAFPAVCTGVRKYPREFVAETLIGSVVNFVNSQDEISLTEIRIVILPDDHRSAKAFDEVIRRRKSYITSDAANTKIPLLVSPTWPCHYYLHIVVLSEALADAVEMLKDAIQRNVFPEDAVGDGNAST